MFDYFWASKWDTPLEKKFQIFTPQHFLILVFLISCIIAACYVYLKCSSTNRLKLKRVLVWTLLVSELIYQIELVVTKIYTIHDLPLQLCGLAIFMAFYHAYRPNKALDDILSSLCMPGAVAALFFCGWTGYSVISFVCVHSFLSHVATITYVCMQLVSGDICLNLRDMRYTALFMCGALPVMYFVNSILGTNFLFINDPTGYPVISWLAGLMGIPWYVIGYFALVLVLVFIMHLIFSIINLKKRSKKVV